jgi:hypothetical protein
MLTYLVFHFLFLRPIPSNISMEYTLTSHLLKSLTMECHIAGYLFYRFRLFSPVKIKKKHRFQEEKRGLI